MFGGYTQSGESSDGFVLHLPTMVRHYLKPELKRKIKSAFSVDSRTQEGFLPLFLNKIYSVWFVMFTN